MTTLVTKHNTTSLFSVVRGRGTGAFQRQITRHLRKSFIINTSVSLRAAYMSDDPRSSTTIYTTYFST